MSYLESAAAPDSLECAFGFKFEQCPEGWRWIAFDILGQVKESGVARTKAEAATLVICALARC